MKTLGFRFDPSVRLLLDEEDITTLLLCGVAHPKFSCQVSVQPGGFVYLWREQWLATSVGSPGIEVEVNGHYLNILELLLEKSDALYGAESPRGRGAAEMLTQVRELHMEMLGHFVRLNPEMAKGA